MTALADPRAWRSSPRMTPLRFWLRPYLIAVSLLVVLPAHAQRAVDAHLFHPAMDSYGIFTVERTQTAHQWDFGFKMFSDYAQNPLRLAMFDTASSMPKTVAIMDWQ